jgi:methionyl-tRNA formyltransferase
MFDTIILLSGPAEQLLLQRILLGFNPLLTIIRIGETSELNALTDDRLAHARLIGFATPVIVPQPIIDRLRYGAFNFHPGPPGYPGWAPAHFSLYNRETEFGATAHVMIGPVDAGPIIDVARFAIPADISVMALEGMAYAHLANLFLRLARALACDPQSPPPLPLAWGSRKYTRRAYQTMCEIPLDIPKDELQHRIEIFGRDHFGVSPTINLHGVAFRAVAPARAA